jgi:type II secretory ATPase GspE/PulE/Tfp pilus assembly ATPase PilB-like protein
MTAEQSQILARPELAGSRIYRPIGCRYCAGTGYIGRIGLFEFIFFDADLGQQIAQRVTEQELSSLLRAREQASLLDDGIAKLHSGLTSFDEVAAVINPF